MKVLSPACFCVLWLVASSSIAASQVCSPASLPFLGSRTNIDQYWKEHITHFQIILGKPNGTQRFSAPYPPPTNGTLHAAMAAAFENLVTNFISPAEAGLHIRSELGFDWSAFSVWTMKSDTNDWDTTFIVQTNAQGQVVPPTDAIISWPLSPLVVVTNPAPDLSGIRQVEYRRWDQYTNPAAGYPLFTTNGSTWADVGNALGFDVEEIDADAMRQQAETGEVVFHYGGGATEVYDILTGQKTSSTVVKLRAAMTGDMPLVFFCGWPGSEIAVESSVKLPTWQHRGSVVLDEAGEGMFIFFPTNILFVRGRIISP